MSPAEKRLLQTAGETPCYCSRSVGCEDAAVIDRSVVELLQPLANELRSHQANKLIANEHTLPAICHSFSMHASVHPHSKKRKDIKMLRYSTTKSMVTTTMTPTKGREKKVVALHLMEERLVLTLGQQFSFVNLFWPSKLETFMWMQGEGGETRRSSAS